MAIFDPIVQGVNNVRDALQAQDTGGFGVSPPNTQTATSHSITIRTDRGRRIGRIQNWAPALARDVDTIFEINAEATGEPLERAPQVQRTNTISIERYELYSFHIGEALGTPVINGELDLVNLTRQIKPFNIREIWRDPFSDIRAYSYLGCWFSNWGITIAANDDRIIKARATIEFARRVKLQ